MERFSHASYVVLGIVALRGPTTAYELKRYVATTVGHFWPLPHASLYREPKRLEQAGLLESRTEEKGRRRQHFAITAAGREALERWLAEPTDAPAELRDEGVLKLHFGALAGPRAVQRLATQRVALHERRLAEFERMRERYRDTPGMEHQLATLAIGIELEEAMIAAWRRVSEARAAA